MKSTIIVAAIFFCIASCNNPSSPAGTNTDSSSINSGMNNTSPGTMNNSDTMNNSNMNNSGNMNNTDSTNNVGTPDSLR